ncbi:hypothetical protein EVAR_30971_1 [Eumeta japonica]|uniref:Uncharacterized protein n=1 Tax=Eumeta variegata TaxID=151549 RepID=A0A4C1W8U0_EUMVA|nr:hypothetical protein EVAR_30971_1 [Eumeta japonica]
MGPRVVFILCTLSATMPPKLVRRPTHRYQNFDLACFIVLWRGGPLRGREPQRPLRYDRELVYRAYVALSELTPGSGPRRPPRRGAAGSDGSWHVMDNHGEAPARTSWERLL